MAKCTTKRRARPPSRDGKPESGLVPIPPRSLRAAEENDALYRPVDHDDPDFLALVESIRRHGVLEPLVVTPGRVVVSGHRRRAAAIEAGVETVPCRILPMDRYDPRFVEMLREFNRQRVKTLDEMLREVVVQTSAGDAYSGLLSHREERSEEAIRLEAIRLRGRRRRARISGAKQEFLDAVLGVIEDRRAFLPLSDRQIHYALLNAPPLIHAGKPGSRYANNPTFYKALCELLTRARIEGVIPMEAIGDETRPVIVWNVHRSAQSFIRAELDSFLKHYWRDFQQSQPNHIEIVGEKNTLGTILKPVAMEFCIPMTLGRGYCSLAPRAGIVERFRKSGKERLVLLIISDFDPDGESIAESLARSIRDDFHVSGVHAVKVALTAEQTREMNLPPAMTAKRGSATYRRFVERHGTDVWEVEALPPETLQGLLRDAVADVLDVDAYNAEVEAEAADARFLDHARQRAVAALRGIAGADA